MPHALTELKLAEVTRPGDEGSEPVHEIRAAMGVGAAHALDLAARARASVHDVDVDQLHQRLAANLGPPP
jgi:hypothetical protein